MAYVANPVNFDGTNDYLNLAGPLSGISDGTIFLFSAWVRVLGGDGVNRRLFTINVDVSNIRLAIHCGSSNTLACTGRNSANTAILDVNSNFSLAGDTTWHHFLLSLNLASTSERALWIDGSAASPTWTIYDTTGTIDFLPTAGTETVKVGASSTNANKWNGDVADLFFTTPGTWFDPSSSGNIAKFIAGGGPIDLGSNGSTPLGSQPRVFMSGATGSWSTNKGTGGGFTEVGALTNGAVALPVGVPIYTQTKFRLYSNTGTWLGP